MPVLPFTEQLLQTAFVSGQSTLGGGRWMTRGRDGRIYRLYERTDGSGRWSLFCVGLDVAPDLTLTIAFDQKIFHATSGSSWNNPKIIAAIDIDVASPGGTERVLVAAMSDADTDPNDGRLYFYYMATSSPGSFTTGDDFSVGFEATSSIVGQNAIRMRAGFQIVGRKAGSGAIEIVFCRYQSPGTVGASHIRHRSLSGVASTFGAVVAVDLPVTNPSAAVVSDVWVADQRGMSVARDDNGDLVAVFGKLKADGNRALQWSRWSGSAWTTPADIATALKNGTNPYQFNCLALALWGNAGIVGFSTRILASQLPWVSQMSGGSSWTVPTNPAALSIVNNSSINHYMGDCGIDNAGAPFVVWTGGELGANQTNNGRPIYSTKATGSWVPYLIKDQPSPAFYDRPVALGQRSPSVAGASASGVMLSAIGFQNNPLQMVVWHSADAELELLRAAASEVEAETLLLSRTKYGVAVTALQIQQGVSLAGSIWHRAAVNAVLAATLASPTTVLNESSAVVVSTVAVAAVNPATSGLAELEVVTTAAALKVLRRFASTALVVGGAADNSEKLTAVLVVTTEASAIGDFGATAETALVVETTAVVEDQLESCETDYAPVPAIPADPVSIPYVEFVGPYDGPVLALTLKKPQLGDQRGVGIHQEARYTRDGTLRLIHRTPDTITFTVAFTGLTRRQRLEFENFVEQMAGSWVRYRDHENRVWRCLLLEESFSSQQDQDSPETGTVELTIEGDVVL